MKYIKKLAFWIVRKEHDKMKDYLDRLKDAIFDNDKGRLLEVKYEVASARGLKAVVTWGKEKPIKKTKDEWCNWMSAWEVPMYIDFVPKGEPTKL